MTNNVRKSVADKPTKAEPKLVPLFDPSAYIRDTYGPIAEPLSCLKAILRELVIMNHNG